MIISNIITIGLHTYFTWFPNHTWTNLGKPRLLTKVFYRPYFQTLYYVHELKSILLDILEQSEHYHWNNASKMRNLILSLQQPIKWRMLVIRTSPPLPPQSTRYGYHLEKFFVKYSTLVSKVKFHSQFSTLLSSKGTYSEQDHIKQSAFCLLSSYLFDNKASMRCTSSCRNKHGGKLLTSAREKEWSPQHCIMCEPVDMEKWRVALLCEINFHTWKSKHFLA